VTFESGLVQVVPVGVIWLGTSFRLEPAASRARGHGPPPPAALHFGRPVRFLESQRAVAPITQKELTRQLRLFEQRGLVRREVFMEMPLRVEYEITDLGRSLQGTLDSLSCWMRTHGKDLRG